MNILQLSKEPDFINKTGTKFWHDKTMNEYIKSKNVNGVSAVLLETNDGNNLYALLNINGVFFADKNRENVAVHIDMMAIQEIFND